MSESVCTNCSTPVQPDARFCPRCGMQYGAQVPPPPPPPYPPAPPYGYAAIVPRSGKEKVPAALLAILLGSLGGHLFYLRHTGWAVAFLLLPIVTCGMSTVITAPIGIIQGILYLIASDEEFERKYVVEHRFF